MSMELLTEQARKRVVPITTEQYFRMNEIGLLPSGVPVELIEGLLVRKDRSKWGEDPKSIHPLHSYVVEKLADLNDYLVAHGLRLRARQPLALPPAGAPEPDGAIVRGSPADYVGRHPGPGDVLCVFEVSDSTLEYDRSTKLALYARAGIPLYVIVNLPERKVETFEEARPDGTYAKSAVFTKGQGFDLRVGTVDLRVEINALLP